MTTRQQRRRRRQQHLFASQGADAKDEGVAFHQVFALEFWKGEKGGKKKLHKPNFDVREILHLGPNENFFFLKCRGVFS